ncbi:MAG TPA: DUF1840 domain-containing protein [Pusillimonas sp.]|jgi:hypothetical protein|nr:hypothetical protein [Pusillimonas sp.]MBC41240.1 hypothetical protein [Pusillimonas sp.]HBT33740.1 DUF1840 domain-containing protein [Pusillimonas sp.]HCN72978.1 DUF1840 domain-containing protein [Pusillimonas sp.]HCP77119.1 DUF1840 domain-containing protein [Pusillimonas sp.]|tara:strand:- start:112234 stop:112575 length:342 start_codon:yes stop_codon:yes gene_type:complete
MLVVFHAKPAAEVLMYAQHALDILRAAGRNYDTLPERGVITATQLDEAIASIEKAMASENVSYQDDDGEENDSKTHPISQPVSFRQRAFPLLAMMRLCREHKADITWEPAPTW